MKIEYDYFSDEGVAQKEIDAAGYHSVTLEVGVESNDDHWHDFDALLYILDGELTITDAETGETCACGAGTKIVANRGVLHREQTEGYKALVGVSVDPAEIAQPINKTPPVAALG